MWHDVETTLDLLNFNIVAKTAVSLIDEIENEPLSIGVSGSWGSGKSSLVKMIAKELKEKDGKKYVFLEFNAWLYQGFDDAKIALLQSVADKVFEEAKSRKGFTDEASDLLKRVKWLKAIKFAAPIITHASIGGAVGGPIGAFVGAISGIAKGQSSLDAESIGQITSAYNELEPQLGSLLKEEELKSLPKEIESFREALSKILQEMNIKLVVFVDDLDRCMPETAISTLEAMRLLLFLPRTVFIIAADEQMIRNAVRTHFASEHFDDDLVTSYFDKLIQVPLRVPKLSSYDVKAFLILLFADRFFRKNGIKFEKFNEIKNIILDIAKKPWLNTLSIQELEKIFGDNYKLFEKEIELSDQLASIMTTSRQLAGNPRLIKRFLNDLVIRERIANAQEMSIPFDSLVKMQLFERCASPSAFNYLSQEVAKSENGKLKQFLKLENSILEGLELEMPAQSWDNEFVKEWLKLSPSWVDLDLRPLLYLSRDKSISLSGIDDLSREAKGLLTAVLATNRYVKEIVEQLKVLGIDETRLIFSRLKQKSRSDQWSINSLRRCLHIPKAFPELEESFISLLHEIPIKKLVPSIVPLIKNEKWAEDVFSRWLEDENLPERVQKALKSN